MGKENLNGKNPKGEEAFQGELSWVQQQQLLQHLQLFRAMLWVA